MVETDCSFSTAELELLRSLKGLRLKSIDACIVARDDMAWNTVRLHFDSVDVDLSNHLGEVQLDESGTCDEFGLLQVSRADSEILDVPDASPETSTFLVDKHISGIKVIEDSIEVSADGSLTSRTIYPQALVFNLGDEFLVFDKEVWFEETIAIKKGKDLSALIYDDSVNWEDDLEEDPSTHYSMSQTSKNL